MTNKSKLVAWDADYYNSLSDDPCFICLTEKERYLVGESLRQIEWPTRWLGDLSTLDLKAIAANLLFRMHDMTICDDNICDVITACIQNNPDTLAAILQALADAGIMTGSGNNPPLPVSPGQSSGNLLPADYVCDDDHLFGMSKYIVQQLHEGLVNMLELMEVSTNPLELIGEFVDNFEGASWIGSALEFSNWLQDQLIEYYQAAYSLSVENELACAIYCLIKDDCELTVDKLLEAYAVNLISSPVDVNNWQLTLDWLAALDLATALPLKTVATLHYFVIQAIRFSNNVFGQFAGINGIKQLISLGANDTDADWETLCTDCPTEWCVEFDFTTSNQSFVVAPGAPYGQYLSGQGWGCTYNTPPGQGADNRSIIIRDFGVSFTPNSYQCSYRATNLQTGNIATLVGLLAGNIVFLHNFGASDPDGNEHMREYTGVHTIDEISPQTVTGTASSGSDPDAFIHTKLRMSGDTGEPPVVENC